MHSTLFWQTEVSPSGAVCLTMLRQPASHVYCYACIDVSQPFSISSHTTYWPLTSQSQGRAVGPNYNERGSFMFAEDQTDSLLSQRRFSLILPPFLFSPKLSCPCSSALEKLSVIFLQNIKISLSGNLHFWFILSFCISICNIRSFSIEVCHIPHKYNSALLLLCQLAVIHK